MDERISDDSKPLPPDPDQPKDSQPLWRSLCEPATKARLAAHLRTLAEIWTNPPSETIRHMLRALHHLAVVLNPDEQVVKDPNAHSVYENILAEVVSIETQLRSRKPLPPDNAVRKKFALLADVLDGGQAQKGAVGSDTEDGDGMSHGVMMFNPGQNIPIRLGGGSPKGLTFAAVQAGRVARLLKEPLPIDLFGGFLKQWEGAYSRHGDRRFIVGALEHGAVLNPSDWMPKVASGAGGGASLWLEAESAGATLFSFMWVIGFPPKANQPVVKRFWTLSSGCGARLAGDALQALGIASENDPVAVWLTFVMTKCLGTPFIREVKGATLLANPFGASLRVLQEAVGLDNDNACKHSEDYTSVTWYGQEFGFNKTQAECVRLLWEAWKQGTPRLSEKTIGERIGSSADGYRLRHTFRQTKDGKTKMHPAWENMIQPAGRGVFQLVRPESRQNPT